MHPVFIRFGEGGVPTYGVAMAVGFLAAVLLAVRAAGRQGVSVNRILDLSFWILVASLLGSRLPIVAIHAGEYYRLCAGVDPKEVRSTGRVIFDCTRALHIWEGGYVFFGGLLLSLPVSLWYTRRHNMSFPRVADVAIPPLALGHFFGRLGCFAAGCCYGKPTGGPLGVSFPRGSLAQMELVRDGKLAFDAATMPLHPTQLYEALAELCNFVLLTLWTPRKAYHGQLLVRYLVLYPVARATVELFRGDPGRGYLARLHTPTLNAWLGLPPQSASLLSLSQLAALVAVAGAFFLSRRLRRQASVG